MSDWSPFKPEVMTDPAAGHQYLLAQCPVHQCEDFDPPFFTLSKYADVEHALRDIETYSSEFGQGPRFTDPQGMLCDPPQHTYFRKRLQSWFTPRAIDALRPRIVALTNDLVDEVLQGEGEFDLHDDFAFPLPVVLIAQLLGVPEDDLPQFKHWSDIQVAAMGAEDPSQYADDQMAFLAYLQAQLAKRREEIADKQDVPDDLLTLIADARYPADELATEADALSVLSQLLVGGNETTTSLITNLFWRVLERPETWDLIKQKPELIPAAVEESLRFDPPVLGLYRNTTREVELRNVVIPRGSKVLINYAAANRDAEVFPNPDTFDIQRPSTRHMSFGLGVHFCIGAPMARMEAEVCLEILAQRMPDLRLLGSGERIAPFFLWGRKTLPVAWR